MKHESNPSAVKDVTLASLIEAMKSTATPSPVAVDVAQWGRLYVRPQTVEEVDAFSELDKDADANETSRKRRLARGAARVICDAQGKRLFDPTNEEHLTLLAQQPWPLLQKVLAKVNLEEEAGGK